MEERRFPNGADEYLITSVIFSLSPEADMFTVDSVRARNTAKLSFLQEGVVMGQKLGGFALIAGCFLMLLGLSFIPAGLAQHQDETILGAGLCAFAFGAFAAAAGMYLKTRALQSTAVPGAAAQPKSRGGCDLCKTEVPVIHCRVHNLHICAECVAKHYDFRSCVYIPSTRRPASAKPVAARAARA